MPDGYRDGSGIWANHSLQRTSDYNLEDKNKNKFYKNVYESRQLLSLSYFKQKGMF